MTNIIPMTKEAAEARIDVLHKQLHDIESEMVNLALEHEIPLYIEGKGSLLLEDDTYTGKYRSEWYTSTDSCS